MKKFPKILFTLLLCVAVILCIIACSEKVDELDKVNPDDAVWEDYDDVSFKKLLKSYKNNGADVSVKVKEGWDKSDELDEDDLDEDAAAYTYTMDITYDNDEKHKIHFFMELQDGELKARGCYDERQSKEFGSKDTENTLSELAEAYDSSKGSKKQSGTGEKVAYVPQAGDEYWLGHIEVENMDGYEFRILSRKGMTTDQYVEEETGDIINDAVYRRNETVKDLFNINIVSIESSSNTADDAINSILAGDDQYDIMFPHTRSAFQYAVQDALINWNDVETIDTSKEWWSQDIIDSCNVNGHLYVLDGDISTHRLQYAFCMYFNKRIFDELGLDYPYQMALDGTWTFDEFSKLVKMGYKDLNNDGLLNAKNDQYGYYTWNWYGPIQVLYSGNQRIYSKNQSGVPELTLNTSKTIEIFSKFFDLTDYYYQVHLYVQNGSESDPASNLFSEGRAMFADMGLGNAKSLRSMNDEIGILPWPKFSLEDEYMTVVDGHASLMVMPVTVDDPNKTGKIVEALCAVGNRDVIPAFYEVSLKTKFSRDSESEAMIDIIKDSIIYDLGYVSGGTMSSVGATLAGMSNHDFASFYAQNESKAKADLNDFLKAYGKL